MKRIIDGQTYNTDTSTIVARYEYKDDKGYDTEATLYQTRGGAFFLVHKWAVDDLWKFHFEAMTRDEVSRLVERTDNLEIVDEGAINEPPEAEAEAEPSATLYIRVPASLKKRVDDAAKESKVSGNVWAMRCVERCLEPDTRGRTAFANAYDAILSILSGTSNDAGKWADYAQQELETAWIHLGLGEPRAAHIGTEISELVDRHDFSRPDFQLD